MGLDCCSPKLEFTLDSINERTEQEIQKINTRFYNAFESLSLERALSSTYYDLLDALRIIALSIADLYLSVFKICFSCSIFSCYNQTT